MIVSQCRRKVKVGTLRDFSTSILSENIKKLKGGAFGEIFFRKVSAENTLREYPLAPLSFLDDGKILLRKLSKNSKKSGPFREILSAEKNYPL